MITQDTLRFLLENRLRNSREWFAENRDAYQELVLRPLQELVVQLTDTVKSVDPFLIAEPKVDRSISRIYRDTRFSRDKSLYREVMWLVFSRDRHLYDSPPGLFFEMSPEGFRYGCGWYDAKPAQMARAREMILERDPIFLAAKEAMEGQSLFVMEGELYKRDRYPDAPAELKNWLNRKCIDLVHNSRDFDLLYSDRLKDALKEGFLKLAPVYRFCCEAEERVTAGEAARHSLAKL